MLLPPSTTTLQAPDIAADLTILYVLTCRQGKRVFIKDITHYLVPPAQQESRIAPSLLRVKRGVGTGGMPLVADSDSISIESKKSAASDNDSGVVMGESARESPSRKTPPFPYQHSHGEPNNPTVIPKEILEKFHFTFLIRHPRSSIPSYYRCTIPPLVERTGFPYFMPEEAGYNELRRVFDYLKDSGLIGPKVCGQDNSKIGQEQSGGIEICVIDADDMLDNPEGVLKKYCESIGVDYHPDMLQWDSEEAHLFAKEQFEKWRGFHDDAINSTDLKPRQHVCLPIRWILAGTMLTSCRRKCLRRMSSCTRNGSRNMARMVPT